MSIMIDYSSLSEDEKTSAFFSFISAALVSREDLTADLDVQNLEVKMTMNGQEVDLVRAWGLYTNYDGNRGVNEELQNRLNKLTEMLKEFRTNFSNELSSASEKVSEAISCAANTAGEIASEVAEERVRESFWDDAPCFTGTRDVLLGEFDIAVEEVIGLNRSLS